MNEQEAEKKIQSVESSISEVVGSVLSWVDRLLHPITVMMDPRFLWLVIPAVVVLLWFDAATVKSAFYLFLFAPIGVGFAHFVRKIMFPTMDMSKLVDSAEEGSIGAAIVVAAGMAFIASIVGIFVFGVLK